MEKNTKDTLSRKISSLEKKVDSYREKLRQARQQNRSLLKQIRDQEVILKQFPGWLILIQDGKVLFTNNRIVEELGYKEDEAAGRPFEAFVHEDSLDYVKKIHKKRLSGEIVPDVYDLDLKGKAGEKVSCEARISKIRYHGRKAFLVGLTPLKRQKEQGKKLIEEEKHRLICRVSDGLANELRTCTQIIGNCLRSAQSHNVSSTQFFHRLQDAREYQEKIITFLEHLGTAQQLKPTLVELPVIIREAIEVAKGASSLDLPDVASLVDVKTFFRASPLVMADPGALRTAIACVISNAIEACAPQGNVLITLEETPGVAHIYIQDNGPGISLENHEKIFDPFYTTKSHHIGLGLTVTSAIFRKHGGGIELASRPGHGAFFSLILPTAKKASRVKIPPAGKALKNKRILILGEDDTVAGLVSELLTSKGATIVPAPSPDKALKLLARRKIELVIAHVHSLTSPTLELLVRALEIIPSIPVVCTIARGQLDGRTGTPRLFRDKENVVFLPRPIETAKFLQTVTRLLTLSP